MGSALGILRTLSRIAKDAARAKSSFLRVFDACPGDLMKYSMPPSKAEVIGASKTAQPARPPIPSGLPVPLGTRAHQGERVRPTSPLSFSEAFQVSAPREQWERPLSGVRGG